MAATYTVLALAHWVGLALIVVGYVLSVTRTSISEVMVWGARIQLLIGLALVAIGEIGQVADFDHAKIGTKLGLALGVVAFAEISRSRSLAGRGNLLFTHIAAGLAVANTIVALFWN